ncbi:methylmalonyl-CoA mutase family protein [Aeromicrobium sp. CF3.5]|uniref:methylmalonyl-CoA mutase family protein n=1 Tax=Aeromicrobium sp. CF3.5 TaxID=3373078 RepID=UPI003EE633F4
MPAEPVSDPGSVPVPLAEGFESSREEWEKATAAVLRKTKKLTDDAPDSDVWSLLATTTLDGISITPLGTTDLQIPDPGLPGQAPYTRGSTAARELDGWDNRAWFADPDPERTASDVTADLENGVNSVWLSLGTGGVPIEKLAAICEPVFIDLAAVVIDAPHEPIEAAEAFAAVVDDKAVAPAPGTTLGVDPIGAALRGVGVTDLGLAVQAAAIATRIGTRAVTVDATAAHDAGASDAQELAYSLATGVTYLRVLVESGIDVADAADLIDFRYAATDEQFPTIAKLRAARRLWHRVLELSGVVDAAGQLQHAVTSRPMMSRYDPYVNMLRTTVAAFAAGVGGAAAVTVLPFDEPLGLPEPFSRRIARNTSSLLIDESHVAAVADPAGGAFAVEQLTDDLARTAWQLFGQIDATPSLEAALDLVRAGIAESVSTRGLEIARRTMPLTGVSEFPHLHEEMPERRPYADGRPNVFRYGHEFAAMRDARADAPVFLATLGTIAQHTARATFVTNLFAAGGIDVVVAGATDGVDEVLTAYREADSPQVVCLCGNDATYADWGTELVTALREAGAQHVVLAGSADVGADTTAAAGLDALAFLRQIRQELGA